MTEAEQRLLSHHPGTPEDHQHHVDAPLDRKADEILRRGALDEVISLAEVAPTRIAQVMGRHRLVLDRLSHHHSLQTLLTLTWDSLDQETRRRHLDRMVRIVLKMARGVGPQIVRRDGLPILAPFRFDEDELDMDATVERLMASAVPVVRNQAHVADYADIVVRERGSRPRACVVMLDESRSMRGSKAVAAALATATLILNLRPADEWGLVAFADQGRTVRAINRRRPKEEIIRQILDMQPQGCTDIARGLELGLKEIARAQAYDHIGIVISDGWLNTGPDPLPLARQFTRLHFIELPGGDHEFCTRMAQVGRGIVAPVRELEEVPAAVRRCLLS